jgi:hypothetical protein
LFSLAHVMRPQVERSGAVDILRGTVSCMLLYEPSTRTSASFESAMRRCSGDVVSVTTERSSVQKGETLQDTIRTLACYGDAVVMRHPDLGSAQLAAKRSPVPILNAGNGTGEHPTQPLLDVVAHPTCIHPLIQLICYCQQLSLCCCRCVRTCDPEMVRRRLLPHMALQASHIRWALQLSLHCSRRCRICTCNPKVFRPVICCHPRRFEQHHTRDGGCHARTCTRDGGRHVCTCNPKAVHPAVWCRPRRFRHHTRLRLQRCSGPW